MSLSEILAAAHFSSDGLRASVPPDWHQGRTAYGGFSAALALSAAMRVGGALPPLRSAQISFVGPLSGRVDVRAKLLRRGRNAVWMAAEIGGEGGVGLTASFVFVAPAASALSLNQCATPADLIPFDKAIPLASDGGPVFLRNHFDVRFALPRTAEKSPEMCWWVRSKQSEGLDPMIGLMLCADCLPPGVMALLPPVTPVSSMQWLVNLLSSAPVTRDGWWLLRSIGDFAEDGCSSQRMEIWNADGAPVASGMQSVALFG